MIETSIWKKALALLEPHEKRTAWVTLAIVIVGALSSALMVGSVMPFLAVLSDPGRIENVAILFWAYERFGFSSDFGFLVALGLASFLVILLSTLMQIVKNYAIVHFALMRGHSISLRLMQTYLRQPYLFFLNRHSGDMSTRLLSEAMQVMNQFFKPAADLIASMLTVIVIVGLLLWVDWIITLIAFGTLGGSYIAIYILIRRHMRRLGQIRLRANQQRFRLVGEAFGGMKELKVTGREGVYAMLYEGPSLRMARSQIVMNVMSNIPQLFLQAVAFGGIVLLCLLLMRPEDLASGQGLAKILPLLGVFAYAGQRIMPELGKIYGAMSQLQTGLAAIDSVHDDLVSTANPVSALSKSSGKALDIRESVTLESISFRYPNAERLGLEDISLSIRAGERLAIVGGTGAGKTTLADIVLGLLEVSAGRIMVDGSPITPERQRSWQRSVGYVPQDIFLTDASVAQNIAFGVPTEEIMQDRVERAARIAHIDPFIRSELPDGYATHVGERGVRLSGGQRQRIGIARALYHDPALVVFDEATSALDNLTEAEVMDAINSLPGDKTVLMIAHRLSTVRHCDRIVVMDKGRVSGIGTWEGLEATNRVFRDLAQSIGKTDAA